MFWPTYKCQTKQMTSNLEEREAAHQNNEKIYFIMTNFTYDLMTH